LLEEDNKLNSFVAGGLAGVALLFLDKDDRIPISLYVFIRAMKMAYDAAETRRWFPVGIKSYAHGDVILMSLSAAQILYAYIVRQDSVPKSYKHFLLGAGRKDQRIISAVRSVAMSEHQNLVELRQYARQHGIYVNLNPNSFTQKHPVCDLMHPEMSCPEHWIRYVVAHFFEYGVRFYGPLNFVTLVLFQRKKLVTDPLRSLLKLVQMCAHSASFLAFYCGNAWFAQCLLRSGGVYSTVTTWIFGGLAAGPAILLEQKSRRMEIALYCMSPALQSAYNNAVDFGWIPRVPNVTTFIFCIASGILMTAHQKGDHMVQPTLARATKLLMGVD